MDHAGTGVRHHVVAEEYRCSALVARMRGRQRMMEAQAAQRLARHAREDGAVQRVSFQAGFDAIGGEDQQAARGIDQAIVDLGIQVQRLVGGDGPRRGGPDHDPAFLPGQGGQAESGSDRGRIGECKADVDRRIGLVLVLDLCVGQR